VIYVMGRGKSGSTILAVALGNCAGVFFAGELCSWLMMNGEPLLEGPERTRFWQDVCAGVDGGEELFGSEAYHCFERGLAAFRIDKWPTRRRLRERYLRVTEGLYRSIARRAGATHVVDTSHLPLRARQLQRIGGIDLYLIFLVRDTESIVASYTRNVKRRRHWRFFMTNGRMWVTYALSLFVFLCQPRDRRLLVRHEDFVANPEGFMREILDFAGSSAELPDLSALNTGIPLKGNPLIRSEMVSLKAKAAPPHRSSRFMRTLERPWRAVLSLLGPTATGTRSREHVSVSDPS
jgi:hypothetical protein